MELDNRGSDKPVFYFSGESNSCALFLGTLREWIAIEVENEGIGSGKIILIDGPIGVRVSM